MFAPNDPLLALIIRFVVKEGDLKELGESFIQRQIQTLQRHLNGFPPEERNRRAMQWIERHAEEYRRQWQKKAVTRYAPDTRCPDCPLSLNGQTTPCEVHDRWLQLLADYSDEKLSTHQYVEDSLRLLEDQKSQLKVTTKRK